MRGSSLDVLLLSLALIFGFIGYRRGFVVGVLSFIGFFGGALLGLQIAPIPAQRFGQPPAKVAMALMVVFAFALGGQAIAFVVGAKLRDRLRLQTLRTVDSIGGTVVSVLTVLFVAWMVAAPLVVAPVPWLSQQIRGSAVLRTLDRAMPKPWIRCTRRFKMRSAAMSFHRFSLG